MIKFHCPITKLVCALMMCASMSMHGATMLVKDGRARAKLVYNPEDRYAMQGARLLNRMLREISGDTLTIVDKVGKGSGYVVIGNKAQKAVNGGFEIISDKGNVYINSAGGKGALYGVTELLERFLGVDYLSLDFYTLDKKSTVELPEINIVETPAFRFRQTQCYAMRDSVYYDWMRLCSPNDVFIDNMWVHTMDRLLPASKYGKEHPEYYAFINGERRPGNHSQWCLTSDAVFEEVCTVLDSIFEANPEKTLISVSQNDGNDTNCRCEKCAALEEYEGAPSGPIIHFMNKLAARYPDKEFSTLAYLFSMQPPQHVKPLPNVNIMLCDIDCMREVPLTDNASGRDFLRAIEGWSAISDNIFVWDYGINFDNVVTPFPNFHIMQPNIQLFHKHHANMMFEQIHGGLGCDLSELRAYLAAKLMWNPYLDLDATIRHFLQKYYGAAAGKIYQYIMLREGALLASGKSLWIYDSPVTHKDGMLNKAMMKEYNRLFDEAERAVASDSASLAHVQMARLPIMYSVLEIARATGVEDVEATKADVKRFGELCAQFGVESLTERINPPAEYCEIYLDRYLPRQDGNKALGAPVSYLIEPTARYKHIADKALTDGLYGGTTYVDSWVGWEGIDGDFIIDLGEITDVTEVTTDFLHQPGAWILEPKAVTWYISIDNDNFTEIGRHEFAEDRDSAVKFNTVKATLDTPAKARYVRVKIDTLGLCPYWHFGVGHPVWFFIDEVTVK